MLADQNRVLVPHHEGNAIVEEIDDEFKRNLAKIIAPGGVYKKLGYYIGLKDHEMDAIAEEYKAKGLKEVSYQTVEKIYQKKYESFTRTKVFEFMEKEGYHHLIEELHP